MLISYVIVNGIVYVQTYIYANYKTASMCEEIRKIILLIFIIDMQKS